MIAIVDYGVGNLFSLSSSVRSLGAEVRVTHEAADLHAASHILLPGVGALSWLQKFFRKFSNMFA